MLCATIRAKGVAPFSSAVLSRINTKAEAPSEIEEALAAVMVPSFANAGRKVGIFSILALNGCSSFSTTVSPLRDLTVTGTISAVFKPPSIAALARDKDMIA